jgi:pseudouridine synthase
LKYKQHKGNHDVVEERVQKLLARAGKGSRRGCEELISQGRVAVNGKIITLGARADPNRDIIMVDGERVNISAEFTYIALNKPRDVISAVSAQPQENRRTVRELVDVPGHLFPVGRLDAKSEGLILMTDDGALAQRLTHPRYGHEKTYKVLVKGRPTEETLTEWRRGVQLPNDDTPTLPAKVTVLKVEKEGTWLRIVMKEGRKRQIRDVGMVLGHPVWRIIRTHIGPLALGALKPGEWRRLTPDEVSTLRAVKHGKRQPRRRKR